MSVLKYRIGGAALGVLAAAGVVVALTTRDLAVAFTLAVCLASALILLLWRERSRSTTRARDRLQRGDPAAVVFVSGRPSKSDVLDHYSTDGSTVSLPALFPVVVDAAGIRYFSTDRSPVPLASIPWSNIRNVGLTDAWPSEDGWLDSKIPVLGVTVDGGHQIVFHVRSLVAGRWEVNAGSQAQLVDEIAATRP